VEATPLDSKPEQVVYIFGVPLNAGWNDIIDAINAVGIKSFKKDRYDHKDESGHDCCYI